MPNNHFDMNPARSLLFVPGDRPERFAKAAASGAHEIILDLEDAVAPMAKDGARAAVANWLAQGRGGLVRINGADTAWFADDLAMVKAAPCAGLMLPKANPQALAGCSSALEGRALVALLETVGGFMQLRQLVAVRGLSRLAFGSVDFSTETGIADESDALLAVRTKIVLASCHAGLAAPVDGVSLELNDIGLISRQAQRSRQLGFGGKLCIHPHQVDAVNSAFRPTPAETQWAHTVVATFEASQGAVTTVDGKMVDKPVVERARLIIAESLRRD